MTELETPPDRELTESMVDTGAAAQIMSWPDPK